MKTIRRFVSRQGKSLKWWNILIEGNRSIIFSGTIGATGSRREKTHRDEDRATAYVDRECQKKLTAGYVEVGVQASNRGILSRAWARIEKWFWAHAPASALFPLATGAPCEDVAKFESKLGFRLPRDFKSSYQRHDGSNGVGVFNVLGLGYWMPLVNRPKHWVRCVHDDWESMNDLLESGVFDDPGFVSSPDGPIRTDHWNRKWIPFTCSDSGDFLALDLSPAKGGRRGQVIFWWHEVGAVCVVAESFQSLIVRLADRLDDGIYEFDAKGSLCPKRGQLNWNELLQLFSA